MELCQVEGVQLPIPGADIESPIDNCWRGVDAITCRIAPKRFARSCIESIKPVVLRVGCNPPLNDQGTAAGDQEDDKLSVGGARRTSAEASTL